MSPVPGRGPSTQKLPTNSCSDGASSCEKPRERKAPEPHNTSMSLLRALQGGCAFLVEREGQRTTKWRTYCVPGPLPGGSLPSSHLILSVRQALRFSPAHIFYT